MRGNRRAIPTIVCTMLNTGKWFTAITSLDVDSRRAKRILTSRPPNLTKRPSAESEGIRRERFELLVVSPAGLKTNAGGQRDQVFAVRDRLELPYPRDVDDRRANFLRGQDRDQRRPRSGHAGSQGPRRRPGPHPLAGPQSGHWIDEHARSPPAAEEQMQTYPPVPGLALDGELTAQSDDHGRQRRTNIHAGHPGRQVTRPERGVMREGLLDARLTEGQNTGHRPDGEIPCADPEVVVERTSHQTRRLAESHAETKPRPAEAIPAGTIAAP